MDTQSQVCCVIRHAERADSAFALLGGRPWTRTDDSRTWPFDPPLSDAGEVGAQETAEAVYSFTHRCNYSIDAIVTSPYLRCVQTAAILCNRLGSDTKLILDASVGEIFGPSVFGDSMPQDHRRPLQSLLDECTSRGVKCVVPTLLGIEPSWPEALDEGRFRFAETFLEYVERYRSGCKSFLVVTHGECVAAATALFPMPARVRGVEPGGMLLASRRINKSSAPRRSHGTSQVNRLKEGQALWHRSPAEFPRSLETERIASKFTGGWSTDSFRIQFEPGKSRGIQQSVNVALRNMARLTARSKLSPEHLNSLLRTFADESFEDPCDGGVEFDCEDSSMDSVPSSTRALASRSVKLPALSVPRSNTSTSSECSSPPTASTPISARNSAREQGSDSTTEEILTVHRYSKTSKDRRASTEGDIMCGSDMNFALSPLWQRRVS